MLWGALLTVRLMVKRPPPRLPTFLMSSFCGFKAVCPANADCWIAEVAISSLNSVFWCLFWMMMVGVGVGVNEELWQERVIIIYGNEVILWITISTHQDELIGWCLGSRFPSRFFKREAQVFIWPCGTKKSNILPASTVRIYHLSILSQLLTHVCCLAASA